MFVLHSSPDTSSAIIFDLYKTLRSLFFVLKIK